MGRRLLDKVVYRIRLCVKANKSIAAIIEAVKVSKKIIYKLRLNLNIYYGASRKRWILADVDYSRRKSRNSRTA